MRRLSRTVLVLVPLHLLAFLLLYLFAVRLVQNEVLLGHGDAAEILASVVVDDLHAVMERSSPEQARAGLVRFAHTHDLLDLELYDAQASSIAAPATRSARVARFLQGKQTTKFELVQSGEGTWSVDGLVSIRSHRACQSCHAADALLGVAAMRYDVTSYYTAATGRLHRNLGLLVLGWVLVMGTTMTLTRRAVQRSVARLSTDLESGKPPSLMLDPLSAELHNLLRESVQLQRQREADMASRLHHTDRLASLGQLAAGLAHEIKNPLAGIQGALEILRDETDEQATLELYEQMLAETGRVNSTVQSLLHFARPGRPQRVATDIRAFLEDSVRLLAPSLRRRQIDIEISTAPDLARFSLDPDQMRQVLVNLITNAAEAIDRNGRIRVRATTFPDGGGLILSVEDNGPGITAEVRSRVFEPFFSTKQAGTGLGLAMARTLVDQHGGSIEVTSQPGEGTTFLLMLPVRDDASQPES